MTRRPSQSNPTPLIRSHVYELRWAGTGLNLALICAVVLLVGGAARLSMRSSFAPRYQFLSDPDTTVISTKTVLARSITNAVVGLVGDSSCMINLDVETVETVSGLKAVNLGTLSYLGLDSFGELAREFTRGKTTPKVILVVHPDCLRMPSSSDVHRSILESALTDGPGAAIQGDMTIGSWLGFDEIRFRLTDRWIPTPLRGAIGVRYGFTRDLQQELLRRRGTMDEAARFDPAQNHGSSEYRLANRIERECKSFRSGLPLGTRVRVIISPVPRSHALKSHERAVTAFRTTIETWLAAETPTFDLPLVLPDADFGTVTHLMADAAKRYSRSVGDQIREWK